MDQMTMIEVRGGSVVNKRGAHTGILPVIDSDLLRVREALRGMWANAPETLRPVIRDGALDDGKLLRPVFLLLSGRLFGGITANHIRAATILEAIHSASLLHDDVLDCGCLRRGVPTVNRRWGNHAAVVLGDMVLARTFELSVDLPRDLRTALARMVERTCDGEIGQTACAGDFEITEQEYLRLLGRKTAALFRGACWLGARLSGADERQCRAAGRFGYNTGMAYQIMDDLLDITGDCTTLRKTLGTDVRRAKVTLPLIHSLRALAGLERAVFLHKLQTRSVLPPELSAIVEETGSEDYVRSRIEGFLDRAAMALRDLPQTPMKTVLIMLSRNCCHAAQAAAIEPARECGME